MIRYDIIDMGTCCEGRCAFCHERGGAYRVLPELLADVEKAQRPLNLYFCSGHAAGSPALNPLLMRTLLEGPRRLKVKVSGAGHLEEDSLVSLLAQGVMLYEVEYLGPNARIHDGITGVKGSFRGVERTMKLLTRGVTRTRAFGRPFVSVVVPVCKQNIGSITEVGDRVMRWRPDRMVFLNTGSLAVSRVVLDLRSLLSRSVARGVWPVLSGFPFCAIPGLEHFSQECYDRRVAHPPASCCEGCLFTRACSGVAHDYLAEYGAAEFGAIAWHRYQEDLLKLMEKPVALPVSTVAGMHQGTEP